MDDYQKQFNQIIDEVRLLAKKHARGRPPHILLSKETAEKLLQIDALKMRTEKEACAANMPPEQESCNKAQDSAGMPAVSGKDTDALAISVSSQAALEAIAEEILICKKCHLSETRTKAVPGEGSVNASLVFVGEAPGASEDAQGRPFVGRSGQLLTDIIEKGMQLTRQDVFICNVVKCRPPDNRVPSPDEVRICEPYLLRQLEILKPKVICALGSVAAQTLLKTTDPIFKLRGLWHDYHGIACRVTYHPAYLLRNPPDKKKAWEDIQEIMRFMRENEIPLSPQ
ncbi:MAG TPA: uracil-DNA glycosylase [Candidatus Hydrogenedentes bacterium]|jgi:DNA polymerase|nr:uracil-DNA glycosylase [Candidatus Hydrogenedentota bacterium]